RDIVSRGLRDGDAAEENEQGKCNEIDSSFRHGFIVFLLGMDRKSAELLNSQLQQRSQPLRLHAADRYLALLFVVHAELKTRFKPGDHFFDPVDIDQVRTMDAPEHIGVKV